MPPGVQTVFACWRLGKAVVLFPALLVQADQPAGPDGIRGRAPHLSLELIVHDSCQALTVPVLPFGHHAILACGPWR